MTRPCCEICDSTRNLAVVRGLLWCGHCRRVDERRRAQVQAVKDEQVRRLAAVFRGERAA